MKTLTAQERKDLVKLERQIPHKGVSTRIKIILALDSGYSAKEVAEILLLDENTVTKWKKLYEQSKFFSDWLGDKNNGYQGKLTKEQEQMIEKFVAKKIVTDCKEIVEYIQNTIGINYSINGITKLLHRLGFVYKQVALIPGKLDPIKQMAFIKEYEALKENKKENEAILFEDGVHPTHNINKTKAWIKKGIEKQIRTNTGRKRLNISGAFDPERLNVTVRYSKTINAQETIIFFDELQEKYKNMKIKLIVDNATYFKNKDVKAYLARPDCRLQLIFLPAYSPNLNFIERLWKYMKKYIIGVKYREKFKDFENDIHQFFDNIHQYEETLKPFIGTKLHLIQVNG